MAGQLDCQPQSYSQQQTPRWVFSSYQFQRLYLPVKTVSEMHFNALRSLTQPCMTAYCLYHNTYDPGVSPGSANQCLLEDMYLRSNSIKETVYQTKHCEATCL